jgi:hypothetical protein
MPSYVNYKTTGKDGLSTIWKKFNQSYEYLWERVQRRRKENHKLMLGGNCILNRKIKKLKKAQAVNKR